MAILKIEITNDWLKRNKNVIENMKKDCIEYSMSGNYGGGVNLEKVVKIMDNCMIEIETLSKKIRELKDENNKLTASIEGNNFIELKDIIKE